MKDKHQTIRVKTLSEFLNIFNMQSLNKKTIVKIEMFPLNDHWDIIIHYQ